MTLSGSVVEGPESSSLALSTLQTLHSNGESWEKVVKRVEGYKSHFRSQNNPEDHPVASDLVISHYGD